MSRRPSIPGLGGSRAALALPLVLLAGCAVGPDYHRPDLAPAAAFRASPQAATPATIDPDWWRAFQDPVLDRLEAQAMAQNLDLAQTGARIAQARAAAGAARAALLPAGELDAKAAHSRQSLDGSNGALARYFPGYPRSGELYDLSAGASWELDIFGGLRRQSEAARAEAQAAEASGAGARISVAGDVADAYLQLRAYQERLAVARRQVDLDRQLLDLVQLRVGQGIAAGREIDQARADLTLAQSTLPLLEAGQEAQLNRLAVLTGQSPEAERAALETPGTIPAPPSLAGAGAPGDLLRRRPDLIAAERTLAAQNARIGAAVSDYYPKISLQGLMGFESTGLASLVSGDAAQSQGVAGLKWRLFDFGRVAAEVAAAKGKRAEALAAYQQANLRACEDVENAFTALTKRQQQAQALTASVEAQTRQRGAANDAYAAGTLSLMEVIDADRQLLQTRDQLVQARAEASRAAVAAFRALGGGWMSAAGA